MPKEKIKEVVSGVDPNAWMLTFSDLVTLLLTFFVMLLSMSTMDIDRIQKIVSSFTGGTGVLEYTDLGAVGSMEEELRALNQIGLDQLPQEEILLDIFLGKGDPRATALFDSYKAEIGLKKTAKGLALVFGARLLFDPGRAELKPSAEPIIGRLAQIINQVARPVSIEGHTDSSPLRQGALYSTNWDLSLARALALRAALVEGKGADPSRIRVAALADARPVADNKTPAGRAMNRRIEILFEWLR